ncbi:MAG: 50S ribosomal protein L5 [bacterium]
MTSALVEDRDEAREQRKQRIKERLEVDNIQAVPELEKVVVNVGLGDAPNNVNLLETCKEHLELVTGQNPDTTRAHKSVAGFGIREGDPIGVKVTLRDTRMDDFVDRLVHIALPQTKDFSGLELDSFDGQGNYTLGIDEHVVFPEIAYDQTEIVFGMDITLVTTTNSDDEAFVVLDDYGLPFQSD